MDLLYITVKISLEDYDEIIDISQRGLQDSYISAMIAILNNIGNITNTMYNNQMEHSMIKAIISWETYEFDSNDFQTFMDDIENVEIFSNNIGIEIDDMIDEINVFGLNSDNIYLNDGEIGENEIIRNRNPTEIICDNENEYGLPNATSTIVGSGNVVQINFDRPTNLGYNGGNNGIQEYTLNYITGGMKYGASSWQDSSTLLLLTIYYFLFW